MNKRSPSPSFLLRGGAARSASDDADLTLESILAEFGSREDGAEAAAELEDVGVPEPRPAVRIGKTAAPAAEPPEPQPSAPPEEASSATPAQDTVSLQEVLESTVQSVLDEGRRRSRSSFCRRSAADFSRAEGCATPSSFIPTSPGRSRRRRSPMSLRTSLPRISVSGTTPPSRTRASWLPATATTRAWACAAREAALLVTALSWLALLLDHFGVMPALFAEERLLSCLPFFIAELLVCVLGRDVFVMPFEQLRARTVTYELLSLARLRRHAGGHGARLFLPARRGPVPRRRHARHELCPARARAALRCDVRYLPRCRGRRAGLSRHRHRGRSRQAPRQREAFRAARSEDAASHWQGVLLPVLLAASLVFAVLSTLRRGERLLFLWNWGVLLTAINMLAFPLCYSLPLRRLTKRFVKSGSALAGYVGADRLRRSNCVILTDTDLFPPGTVSLNGLKIYGEESGKVISYAATMAHASQSGLSRLFDTLLEGEGGRLEPLDDLSFYEEGGVSGLIHGETVLFGTAAFCRKMHVTMPGGLSLKTGAFLAVDGTLIAIFAVKYTAAENVDWALHALKRSRITPVLAVRDGSITPALLKRKFGTDARAVYPTVSTRLALSEKDGEHPYALLYREGLMPYAEIAVGSKRLVHAVRVAAVLSLGSSAMSALLAFYLTFVGAYSALTPVSMLLYLLLWALAALIEGFWADRY